MRSFIILSIANLFFFAIFSSITYQAQQNYKDVVNKLAIAQNKINVLSKELSHEQENLYKKFVDERERRDKITYNNRKKVESLTEKLAVVEEAIDPKDFRWAKIKKVRTAVKKTIEEFEYRKNMSTVNITKYASAVVDFSSEYDVPIPLILALTRKESAFNSKAKSHAGALGLTQVMPATAVEIAGDLGIRHYSMYKIRDSVRFGTYYIMKMIDRFDGSIDLAIRAYNAGPTYVRKVVSGEYSDYPSETKDYARKILGDEELEGFITYYENMGL